MPWQLRVKIDSCSYAIEHRHEARLSGELTTMHTTMAYNTFLSQLVNV